MRDTGIEPVHATGNVSRAASTTATEASLEFRVEIGGTTADWRKLRGSLDRVTANRQTVLSRDPECARYRDLSRRCH